MLFAKFCVVIINDAEHSSFFFLSFQRKPARPKFSRSITSVASKRMIENYFERSLFYWLLTTENMTATEKRNEVKNCT